MTAVVDANAGIEVGLNRSRSKDITSLLRRFDQILTPSLYYAEITNALWKYLRSNRIGSDTAKQGLRIASELIDQYIDIQKYLDEVLTESVRLDHPVYDIFYLVLARRTDSTIITLDKRFRSLIAEEGLDIFPDAR